MNDRQVDELCWQLSRDAFEAAINYRRPWSISMLWRPVDDWVREILEPQLMISDIANRIIDIRTKQMRAKELLS